ncbi:MULTISPECIES: hypothetical protein [unclassified Leptolyngbya]|uniref:hypothetical protein n=1 Tax=unclassified Leptolyngbya TaxID=2650499 RepID=UPI00168321EE|nr:MULTISPECIES: hypothetical protein [unclassified Leptolyngbya]MBD1914104.1 hypothetical protein [Leptolyngbya sp. FACHB-8]MBD2157299.1 hypothetical protein [Leptolyngbya sp. FACHB-16]
MADTSILSPALADAQAQRDQVTAIETYSWNFLGPVFFTLSDLKVNGTAGEPMLPDFVASGQSPYIVAEDEKVIASVKISFNKSPLSALLMCLETKITMNFHFEGQGNIADEVDQVVTVSTTKDTYDYTFALPGTARKWGMDPGLYVVSATAEVGPAQHKCSQFILGYGYIADVLLKVYPSV